MYIINGTTGATYPVIANTVEASNANQGGQDTAADFLSVFNDSIKEQMMQSMLNQMNGGTNSMFGGMGGLGGTNAMLGGLGGLGGLSGIGGTNAMLGEYMPALTAGIENTLISAAGSGEMSGAQLMLFMMIMMMQSGDSGGGDTMPIMQMMVGMLSKFSGDTAVGRQNNMAMPQNMAGDTKRMVDIALEQVGYRERNADGSYGNGNRTKFGAWYGMDGQPWCAMFVSWAADQAGLLNNIVPKHASTLAGANAYRERGLYAPQESGYIPREGDAIYFYSPSKGRIGHVGIVVAYDHETRKVYTVEGNTDNAVRIRHYDIDNPRIDGYGRNGGISFGRVPIASSSGTGANTD